MSWQACQYARAVLEDDDQLPHGARLVLMLLAERANRDSGQTYTGGWLCRAARMHPSSVRRSLYELADAGLIALHNRPGKATTVRFPLAGAISTPRADERAVVEMHPAPERAAPRAVARATPRPTARRTEPVQVYEPAAPLCVAAGCPCEGSGWVRLDDGAGVGYVAPCSGRGRSADADRAPKAVGQ